jgi:hypothetical protein
MSVVASTSTVAACRQAAEQRPDQEGELEGVSALAYPQWVSLW